METTRFADLGKTTPDFPGHRHELPFCITSIMYNPSSLPREVRLG